MTKSEVQRLIDYVNIKGFLPNNFNNFSKLYSMTTENVFGFLSKYNLKNKKVLTVAGSGDQRLNSYLLGASSVTCFDVNAVSEFQLNLKDKAIEYLEYDEFIKFFGIDNTSILDSHIFDKFKSYLDDDSYYFYDFIINGFRRSSKNNIYYDFEDKLYHQKKLNGYLDYTNYKELGSIIENKKIDFINVGIDNLSSVLAGEKFDYILLSNISDYIHLIYQDRQLERFKEVIDKLIDNLNLYGIMQVGYIYSRYSRGEDVSKFHFNKTRNDVFPNYIFHSCLVDSYYNDGTYDKIITYQKLK